MISLAMRAIFVFLPWFVGISLGTAFFLSGKLLEREDQPAPGADAIVVLSGDVYSRTAKAVELYRAGLSNRLIITRDQRSKLERLGLSPESAVQTLALLDYLRVPKSDITYLGTREVSSTLEEAEAIREHVESWIPRPKRLVIVTSWCHTARAYWHLRKVFPPDIALEFVSAKVGETDAHNWWTNEQSFLLVFTEHLKWAYHVSRSVVTTGTM